MTPTPRRTAVMTAATILMAATLAWLSAAGVSATPVSAGTPTPSWTTSASPIPTSEPAITDWWTPAGCAAGQLSGLVADPDLGPVLPGEATLCTTYKDKYRFGVAVFRPDDRPTFVYRTQLVPYHPTDASPVRIVFPGGAPPANRGVCLMRSEQVRLACVELVGEPDGTVAARSIPVDHPLVDRAITLDEQTELPVPSPGCANCVAFPEQQ